MWETVLYLLLDVLLAFGDEADLGGLGGLPAPLWDNPAQTDSSASWLVAGTTSELDYQAKVSEARERIRAARKERPIEPLPAPFVPVAVVALCRAMAQASGEPTEEQWEAMQRVLGGHEAFAKFRPEGLKEMFARAARGTPQPVALMADDVRMRFPDEQLGAVVELLEEVMRADGRVWAAERELLEVVRARLAPYLAKAPATPRKDAG